MQLKRKDNDCNSMETYGSRRSFAEIIKSIPKTANKSK